MNLKMINYIRWAIEYACQTRRPMDLLRFTEKGSDKELLELSLLAEEFFNNLISRADDV